MLFKKVTNTTVALIPFDSEAKRLVQGLDTGKPIHFNKNVQTSLKQRIALQTILVYTFHNLVDTTPVNFRGKQVPYLLARFKEDIIVLSGFYDLSRNLKGDIRPVAISLSNNKLSEKKAKEVLQKVLETIIKHYAPNKNIKQLMQDCKDWQPKK